MSDVKNYRIEFFQLSFKHTERFLSLRDAFQAAVDKKIPVSSDRDGVVREIWRLLPRDDGSFAGELRKFRQSDLPDKGAPGKQSAPIPLEEDEGIIERNFFVYYPQHHILGWHRNHIACGISRFAGFLTTIFSSKVTAAPLLEKEAVARLMKGDIRMKKIQLTLPRPRSTELYPDTDFSQKTLSLLNDAGADTMQLVMGINTRRGDSEGKLRQGLKFAMQELVDFGARKAVIEVYDAEGVVHPIDLIADRIVSTQSVVTDARFPPSGTMYRLIDTAYTENRESINAYTGEQADGTID
ncbi:DUF6731 family protein [Citrobacter amalonaticus]|uniref:DUF6731 family protein n=1 Tax=Citrobacter amalonaticus TaxID=35703 RepID=UPI00292A8F98|nr:DUF6731 family protein [Citrobacter amalonaticus]MDV0786231.1 DUF6731 family protein [Citrobacter amalonaticus]MEB0642294.1 DUF6731 family protein [Citrobacter amalonaticus]